MSWPSYAEASDGSLRRRVRCSFQQDEISLPWAGLPAGALAKAELAARASRPSYAKASDGSLRCRVRCSFQQDQILLPWAGLPAGALAKAGASAGSRTRINGFGGHYTIHCATLAENSIGAFRCSAFVQAGFALRRFNPCGADGGRDSSGSARPPPMHRAMRERSLRRFG